MSNKLVYNLISATKTFYDGLVIFINVYTTFTSSTAYGLILEYFTGLGKCYDLPNSLSHIVISNVGILAESHLVVFSYNRVVQCLHWSSL